MPYMFDVFGWLDGKKTYVAAVGIIIAAIASFLNGDATLSEAITTALEGMGIAALRHGVGKS